MELVLANSLSDPRYRQIIDRLREARVAAKLTQAEVAHRTKVPQSFIAKTERYERRLDIVEFLLMAEAIGVHPADLFSNER